MADTPPDRAPGKMPDTAPERDLEIAQLLTVLQRPIEPDERAKLLAGLARRFRTIGQLDLAREALEEAARIAPDLAVVRRSLGLARFGRGDWAEGLEIYDSARWHMPEFEKFHRGYPQPAWQGEDVAGKHLLLWAEQGIGDQVMQTRVLGPLLTAGAKITVETDPRMHPLIRRAHPQVHCVTQRLTLDEALKLETFDYQVSMLSAWRFVELPKPQPGYLIADERYVAAFRKAWQDRGWTLNVGVSWRSRAQATGAQRTLSPLLFRPLMERADLTFHSLQYDADATEVASIARALGKPLYRDKDSDPLKDLDRQAAQIAALDLVISIDNATVHLAGALGVETWVLLPPGVDWRWGPEGERTDLYDALRLVRNAQMDHWGPALKALVDHLADWRGPASR